MSSIIASATNFDVVFAVFSTEHIAVDASYSVCRELTQAKIAYVSAWKIVLYLPSSKTRS